ncbi:flagellar basal body-associated protein FliL [Sporosarcina sp. resist]|uniref:flagellar basal body-associated protein FliL n=1 Tax=unclassified Sporosarcina TaxID=2647733 RepID=UPI00164DF027|nr:flagellar basal body-associated protein FliL [Sporosarcina sp. resist]QNK86940.1 flagellar basal body-associated protein FliL [Sporosarcina sp. resist]
MKNKVLTVSLIILVCITLIGVVGLILVMQLNKDDEAKEPTIDEIVESSVDIEEITTNLGNRQFIKITLKIQTDNKLAGEELAKRDFQVKNIVIQELSEMTAQDLEGKAGKQAFEDALIAHLNPLMQNGEIQKIYIVSYIIQ